MISLEERVGIVLPAKVWCESELGMLGPIECTWVWLIDEDFDYNSMEKVACVKVNNVVGAKVHRVALEHIHIDVPTSKPKVNAKGEGDARGNGEATEYYEIPKGATELRHLIKHKKMEHGIGEAFCALYRLNDNGEYVRNLKKARFYIDCELENITQDKD